MGTVAAGADDRDATGRFSDLLTRSRTLAGLTQEELAHAAGISLRAVGDMERGRTLGPQRRTVQALADALRLDPCGAAELEQAAQAGRPRRAPAPPSAPPATGTGGPAVGDPVVSGPDTGGPAVGGHGSGGADAARSSAPSALALPRDIADFTARDDALARLHAQALDPAPTHPRVTLVCGHPGLGKTAFALHAAHTLAHLFPDGQLSLDLMGMAATPLTPREALAQLLRALGVPGSEVPADAQERAGLYRSLVRKQRVVLVLDNAADEAQVRPLLPGSGPALTIITSRQSLPGLESVHRLPLHVLDPVEATTLLARIAGPERTAAEPDATLELARLCGHLPLALRIAGQRLATRPQQRISHLVRQLTDDEARLDTLQAGDLRIRAAFGLSYQRLPARAQLVLRRCSLTAGPDFTAATAAVYSGLTLRQAERQLEELSDAGLLQPAAPPRSATACTTCSGSTPGSSSAPRRSRPTPTRPGRGPPSGCSAGPPPPACASTPRATRSRLRTRTRPRRPPPWRTPGTGWRTSTPSGWPPCATPTTPDSTGRSWTPPKPCTGSPTPSSTGTPGCRSSSSRSGPPASWATAAPRRSTSTTSPGPT